MGNSDAYAPRAKPLQSEESSKSEAKRFSTAGSYTCSCGEPVKEESVICLSCGRQLRPLKVEILKSVNVSNEEAESSFTFWGTFLAVIAPYIGILFGLVGLTTGRRRAGFVVGLSLILLIVYTFILMVFFDDPFSLYYF